ncbi:MAG: PPOX class F420-dependent oxidoreductase [Candidatus Marsarchaeota archaeon]|jgi:PPOX class probable F420-dependent enzyme|nr:PPOX class F420-dependent oxidoreductase [Candidatus Marsarchaeota archaeon]
MVELPPKAKELIDGKNFASVATLMKDGSPQVTTTWVDRDGDTVLINTTENRVKIRNVRRDPRVAIGIYRLTDPYDAVYIRGVVREITRQGAEEHVDRLSQKYVGTDYRQHGDRVILRIEPIRVFVQKQ